MNKPLLIVVTGRPGSGKTTLAHTLSQAIHCPALCRDEFKEGFVHTMNSSHDALDNTVNWDIYDTFFQTVELMVSKGISLVIEAAFQHKLWYPKLESLQYLSRMTILICTTDPMLARSRCIARSRFDSTRARFHGDQTIHTAKQGSRLPIDHYTPPKLSTPTLNVDTTDGYRPGMETILSFVMQFPH